jgi:hypothetical protein
VAWAVDQTPFVDALTTAIVLWRVAYPQFLRFRAVFLTLTFAGFATYVVYPAVPPWMAATRGNMSTVARVVHEMWRHVGVDALADAFGEKSHYAYAVGALPSLHAAYPFLLMLFFWSRAGRWRPLLVAYTLAMAVTLVYSADHFVFDILLGWIYAGVAFVVVSRVMARRAQRTERSVRSS